MRRHHIWYLLAILWAGEAIFGFLRRNNGSALVAVIAAACFLLAGILHGRRQSSWRRSRG